MLSCSRKQRFFTGLSMDNETKIIVAERVDPTTYSNIKKLKKHQKRMALFFKQKTPDNGMELR